MDDKEKKRLEKDKEIKRRYSVKELWSWTKYKCWKNDRWEYFLRYIRNIPYDKENPTMYLKAGTYVHEVLEWMAHIPAPTYEEREAIVQRFHDTLDEYEMQGCRFNEGDKADNDKLRQAYEADLTEMFRKRFFRDMGKRMTEVLLLCVVERFIVFRGYADFIHKKVDINGKTIFTIVDYKTSAIYSKKKREAEKYQLLIYAKGLHDTYKVPYENIRIGWDFLRYAQVDVTETNGKKKTYYCERTKIGFKLQAQVKKRLNNARSLTDEEKEKIFNDFLLTNDKSNFPQWFKKDFVIRENCFIEVPFTVQDINDMCEEISSSIRNYKSIRKQYDDFMEAGLVERAEELFMQEVNESNYYRISHLGNYSRALHKPLNKYLNERAKNRAKKTIVVYDNAESTDKQIDEMLAEAGFLNTIATGE